MFRLAFLKHKKPLVGLLIITLIYIIFILCFIHFFQSEWVETKKYFDTKFGEGYAQSLSSSMLEDLIFFGALGLIVTIISFIVSFSNPEDNKFEIRIRSLANSKKVDVDNSLYKFLESKALSFLAFNDVLNLSVEIRDVQTTTTPSQKTYLIFSDSVFHITNMCSDVDYLDNKAKIFLNGDIKVAGVYGTLVMLGELQNPSYQMEPIVDDKFTKEIPIKIQKNSEVVWAFKHEMWGLVRPATDDDRWNYFETVRYTKTINLNIKNCLASKTNVNFDLETLVEGKKNSLGTNIVLKPDEPYLVKLTNFFPNDKINYYFY